LLKNGIRIFLLTTLATQGIITSVHKVLWEVSAMTFDSDLTRATVETIILQLLSERQMYGYEIIKVVNERTDGAFRWKEGTLYPCLHRLEGAGVIASEWIAGDTGKPRKYYRLTARGLATAKAKAAEWSAFSTAMNTLMTQPA
jgi:DNA-binding PadR family transcriptional regulator